MGKQIVRVIRWWPVVLLLATIPQARIVIEEEYFYPITAVTPPTPVPTLLPIPTPASDGLPSNLPRFWTDIYATDSAGYCPYVAGYGWTGNLAWPVVGSVPESRGFHPGHKGIDIEVPEGTPVVAAQAGTVIWSGYSQFGGGLIVVLAHGGGWRTVYAHLSQSHVVCGQVVARGSQIGLSGKTGTSWYHLHFAVERDANAYDPLDYLVVITPN